eukprot:712064-Pleurochrysis_carterae.AAC.1
MRWHELVRLFASSARLSASSVPLCTMPLVAMRKAMAVRSARYSPFFLVHREQGIYSDRQHDVRERDE